MSRSSSFERLPSSPPPTFSATGGMMSIREVPVNFVCNGLSEAVALFRKTEKVRPSTTPRRSLDANEMRVETPSWRPVVVQEESSDEDTADEAYAKRHAPFEMKEKELHQTFMQRSAEQTKQGIADSVYRRVRIRQSRKANRKKKAFARISVAGKNASSSRRRCLVPGRPSALLTQKIKLGIHHFIEGEDFSESDSILQFFLDSITCSVCGSPDNEDMLVFCDSCGRAFHLGTCCQGLLETSSSSSSSSYAHALPSGDSPSTTTTTTSSSSTCSSSSRCPAARSAPLVLSDPDLLRLRAAAALHCDTCLLKEKMMSQDSQKTRGVGVKKVCRTVSLPLRP